MGSKDAKKSISVDEFKPDRDRQIDARNSKEDDAARRQDTTSAQGTVDETRQTDPHKRA